MMNILLTGLMMISAVLVILRCLSVIAHMSHRRWIGHQIGFLGLSIAYALVGCGAVGAALGWMPGCAALVVGVAMLFFSDRRA
jgi:hypothetical protein